MKKESATNNEYKGYPLFNNIEDLELKSNNRANILANIFESRYVNGKISMAGTALIVGYVGNISEEERANTVEKFVETLKERGFDVSGRN